MAKFWPIDCIAVAGATSRFSRLVKATTVPMEVGLAPPASASPASQYTSAGTVISAVRRAAICQRPASADSRSRREISRESSAKRSRSARSLPIVLVSRTPATDSDSSTSVVSRASRVWRPRASDRRLLPRRNVNSRNSGTTMRPMIASCQSSTNSTTATATVVTPLLTTEFTVVLTTLSTPPTSLNTRERTSPVRVWVKNARDIRCRWPYTDTRRSFITDCPMVLATLVVATPIAPLPIDEPIIPSASRLSSTVSR